MSLPQRRITRPEDFGRVALLRGGSSAEREISLLSGRFVGEAMTRLGLDWVDVDPAAVELGPYLQGLHVERVFIMLHGPGGEDGTVQGALEYLGLPYTGSGVLGCALAMDKVRSKRIWQALGVPTPEYALVGRDSPLEPVLERLGLPLFVKPSHEGSSLGMARVDSPEELAPAVAAAAELDPEVLIERCIVGPEYTVSMLGGQALPSIRIDTPRRFYDYQAKYFADDTTYTCPSDLPPALEARMGELAQQAFAAIGGSGWGRVDFMRDADDGLWCLEANLVPGMTDHSLVPMAARAVGLDYDELVWRILETSLEGGA